MAGSMVSRRTLLSAAAALPLAGLAGRMARGQAAAEVPPILFVHGNGDHAALWMTTLWRMESNGIARDRMTALDFTDPNARTDDAVAQPLRSSTADQRRELGEAVALLKRRTGAPRIALVASSRGGYAARSFIKDGSETGQAPSHAVLCGVPNHGIFDWDDLAGSEFNSRGAFLRDLNGSGDSEVSAGTAFLTLRSDGLDKYAQPDGRYAGKPGATTGTTAEGPALKGATNLVIGALDHREVAFHPRAFREIFKFIAGREPTTLAIAPEADVRLSGRVTGTPGGVATNRPVDGAAVEVWRVDAATGARIGEALHAVRPAADGRWGPVRVDPAWPLEFVLTAPDAPITHTYRSPFPRSSDVVHLRPAKPVAATDQGAGAVVQMSRPTGYFGLPRDVVLLDGREPTDVKPGVPTDSQTTLRLPAAESGRSVAGLFNGERLVGKAWPLAENRVTILELTY